MGGGGPDDAPPPGRRLADLFPDARLIEIDDSYTLLPEDQPEQLTRAIRDFVPPYAGTHR